ncbi:hypothetical protein FS837_004862, partial [Tulasnella sp. UAMH 9824]
MSVSDRQTPTLGNSLYNQLLGTEEKEPAVLSSVTQFPVSSFTAGVQIPSTWSFGIGLRSSLFHSSSPELFYSATLDDGQPLPEWLGFDNRTISLYGNAPFLDASSVPQTFNVTVGCTDYPNRPPSMIDVFVIVVTPGKGKTMILEGVNATVTTEISYDLRSALMLSNSSDALSLDNVSVTVGDDKNSSTWLSFDSSSWFLTGVVPASYTAPATPFLFANATVPIYIYPYSFAFSDTFVTLSHSLQHGDSFSVDLSRWISRNGTVHFSLEDAAYPVADTLYHDAPSHSLKGSIPKTVSTKAANRCMMEFSVEGVGTTVTSTSQLDLVLLPALFGNGTSTSSIGTGGHGLSKGGIIALSIRWCALFQREKKDENGARKQDGDDLDFVDIIRDSYSRQSERYRSYRRSKDTAATTVVGSLGGKLDNDKQPVESKPVPPSPRPTGGPSPGRLEAKVLPVLGPVPSISKSKEPDFDMVDVGSPPPPPPKTQAPASPRKLSSTPPSFRLLSSTQTFSSFRPQNCAYSIIIMTSGSTLTGSQPPPEPPAIPGRIPQTPPDDAREPSVDEGVEYLKQEIGSILKAQSTKWPEDSTAAAEGLLDTIHLLPSNVEGRTPELLTLVKQHIRVLDDVRIRLKDASSKSEMKRWKFLERIKSLTSNRPSKCTLLFQTCQDDVAKAINALNQRLSYERVEKCMGSLESPSQVQPGSPALDPATGSPEQGTTADDSATKSPTQAQSNNPMARKTKGPISDSALTAARKTFKSVELASGAIPVVGSYVGAAAKVGLAFVEMLQTMDRNNSLAIDLADHTSNLTKLLKNIRQRSKGDEQDIIGQIRDLHQYVDDYHWVTCTDTFPRELGHVGDRVEEWSSLGRFSKAFSARDHAETLKAYQGTIQKAREEIQLLVSLDSRNITVELENMELRKERDRLLECLGDGQYGARGNMIEDIICFPGTRQEILEKIEKWIRDMSPASRVMWICGMAGRGKSTIASTVVHHWRSRASCALFHFRRGQNALNSRVICALARQLGDSLVPDVKNAILESVRQNKGIAELGRRLDEQFENLFVAPFEELKNNLHPILIVVDALDECDNPKDAVDFVRLIHKHSSSFPTN